ncbi:MAG: DUF1924 domain-containing protein [Cocleimonas sp.]|nr:DUF1924 domain-containing protein [Cocleimonas sp.]
MKHKIVITTVLLFSSPVLMADAINDMFAEYQQSGVSNMDAKAGEAFWKQEFTDKKTGKMRSCTTCHGTDLTKTGKHIRTGKPIKPMAPSANKKSLTDVKKIKKWFKRNCKWTLGRECTAQEQADILSYLKTL